MGPQLDRVQDWQHPLPVDSRLPSTSGPEGSRVSFLGISGVCGRCHHCDRQIHELQNGQGWPSPVCGFPICNLIVDRFYIWNYFLIFNSFK